MDISRTPLDAIRAHLATSLSPDTLGRHLSALRNDPRRGAGRLADGIERRLARERAEQKRLAGLLGRRRRLMAEGARAVAGVDEVGVGPLAGPVVAAAVILADPIELPGLDDSKRLSPTARERLDRAIRSQARAVSLGEVPAADVDRLNPRGASLEAMRLAVVGLSLFPDHVLVDARTIPDISAPQTPLIHGDAIDALIAAASIVAKVYRDALMRDYDRRYPGYGFDEHKGYGTQRHLVALRRLGPSPIHRRSFAPVAQLEQK